MSKSKMPLVLVTGGAGYIGQVLVQKLLDYGTRVRVVDMFYFPTAMQAFKHLELIKGDVCDPLDSWFAGVDAVCHLAGFSNDPTADADPIRNTEVNEQGTLRVGNLAKMNGIKKFTYASSASVYDTGRSSHGPSSEADWVSPMGHYSISKYNGEQMLWAISDADFQPIILRQATVYGNSPRMRFDLVVNTMMRSALTTGEILIHGGGTNYRPLVSVNDVAMAHISALAPRIEPGTYNVVGDNLTVRHVAVEVQAGVEMVTGKQPKLISVPYPEGMRVRDYRITNNAYHKEFGSMLKTNIRYTVAEMATAWQGHDMFRPEYSNITWMELVG